MPKNLAIQLLPQIGLQTLRAKAANSYAEPTRNNPEAASRAPSATTQTRLVRPPEPQIARRESGVGLLSKMSLEYAGQTYDSEEK